MMSVSDVLIMGGIGFAIGSTIMICIAAALTYRDYNAVKAKLPTRPSTGQPSPLRTNIIDDTGNEFTLR